MNVGDIVNGQYRLEAKLGEGGFAVVWRATHVELGRSVALKLLKTHDDEMIRRFRREARVLGQLHHPNCVEVYDAGTTHDGTPFLALELVHGYPLSHRRGERLPIAEIEAIARQVVSALRAAHDLGVVHRDLKPENVMVGTRDGVLDVRVLDFGVAKITLSELPDITKTGVVVGTPHYMSPEQLRGSRNIGPVADQYSLGVMLFELIEGRLPFDGPDPMTVALAQIRNPPPPITRSDCPDYLRDLVMRLMSKSHVARFADTGQLEAALRARTVPKRVVELGPADEPKLEVPPTAVVGVVVIALAALGAFVFWPEPKVPPPTPPVVRPPAQAPTPIAPVAPEPEVLAPAQGDGCGKRAYDLGLRFFGAPETGVTRFVPEDYDPNTRYPMILILRGGNEDGNAFVKRSGLLEIAKENDVVLLAPEAVDNLDRPSIGEAFTPIVRQEQSALCIDPDRIFVVAQHNRAFDAAFLRCEPWVRALAVHAYRLDVESTEPPCPGPDKPTIVLWPMRAPDHPVDGKRTGVCGDGRAEVYSLAEMEGLIRERNGCAKDPRGRVEENHGYCVDYACDVPYRSCYLEGGLAWPGTAPREPDDKYSVGLKERFRRCDGVPADFPAARVVWDFFSALDL